MCHQKVHHCKYCEQYFQCDVSDIRCPSLNDDRDANMCVNCRGRLDEFIEEQGPENVLLEDYVGEFAKGEDS